MNPFARAMMFGSSRLTLPTTNLLAAWDARLGVTNVSGACSAWADQSGNGFHATQGTAGSRPAVSSTGGYPSLLFDGSNDHLVAPVVASSGVKTVYAVTNPTVDSSPRILLRGTTGLDGVGAFNSLYQGNDAVGWRSSGVAYATGLQRVAYQVAAGASGFNFWKNGVASTPASWTTSPSFTSAYIGTTAPSFWAYSGHILFLAIYNATRNAAVEAYLQQEFGV